MMTLLIILLLLAFVSGAPLFTIMLGAAALGAVSLPRPFSSEFDGMVEHMLNVGLGDQVQVMSTIPLFIYAGYLLAESGTADRLVRFANALLGWAPGGLAIVTILTCALFTVFTGASGVTIIALGGVLLPALVRGGYPERFSMGLIAGTGSVGLLFPPALPLFIYGTVYGLTNLEPELWDTRRFLVAGIVPGFTLVGMLCAVAVTVAVIKKLPRQKFDLGELGTSLLLALPELAIPFGVIFGLIVIGFDLPQIAALTVVYTVVLEVGISRLLGKLGVAWGAPLAPRVLWTVTREAMAMVGAIFIIIFASTAFTNYLVTAEVPRQLVAWTQAHVESRFVFLLAINVILLVVGTVMDIFSAIVIVLPLIGPIAKAYGIDPYHLGVIFLLNLEVGYLHPPVGLNLFITSVKFQRPITEVMWATIPFLATMFVALLVVTYVPALTIVPEPERTGRVQDLARMIHNKAESLQVVRDLALVDAAGAPLKDASGAPIVKHIADCEKLNEPAKGGCENLFFSAKACHGKPDEPACTHKAIAAWVVQSLNGVDDGTSPIITVTEVAMLDGDGNAVKTKAGAPVIRTLAQCESVIDKDSCRELFINVSNCKISPPDDGNVDGCVRDKIVTWYDANKSMLDAP